MRFILVLILGVFVTLVTATAGQAQCTFSNGGLNPQALTESGVAAPAGFFWSEVQHVTGNTTVSNTVSGFAGIQGTQRLADNFTLTVPCTINTIAFYSYQTGGPATTPFTGYTLRIWNGRPGDVGSAIVFGDDTTNRLATSVDTTNFRIFNTVVPAPGTPSGTTRKIWRNTVTVGTVLAAGSYWVDWASTITAGAAHFDPGKTIAGSRGLATDNGRQLTVATGVWADALDTGNPVTPPSLVQDFPFDVAGLAGGATPTPTSTPVPTATPTATPCSGTPATFSYTTPAVAIPDNVPAGVNIPITVSGVTTVADLNFRLNALAGCSTTLNDPNASLFHTFNGDLSFKLTSPGGTTVNLITRRGGSGDNYCTVTLDDQGGFPAASTIPTTGAVAGNFTPESPLAAFNGQAGNGVWTLNVSDNAGLDTGSLNRFSLIVTPAAGCGTGTPTATPTNTPTATPTATPVVTNTPTATPTATPAGGEVIYGMTVATSASSAGVNLVRFTSTTPGTPTTIGPFTGMTAGHAVRSIDFRPATGQLFAISTAAATPAQAQIYTVNLTTAALTPVGTGFLLGTNTSLIVEMDFNPVVDRIRIVTGGSGVAPTNNFRANPNDGTLAATDTGLAFDASSPRAGSTTYTVLGAAYTNNVAGATSTTLYAWDYFDDALLTIGGPAGVPSPNGGLLFTINTPATFLTFNTALGMDISGATGTLYVAHDDPATGATLGLYTRSVTTGAQTLVGNFPAGSFVGDLSVQIAAGPTPTPTATPTATPTTTPTATPTATPTPATSVQFTSAAFIEDESQVATISISRTGVTTGASSVTFATSNGTAVGGAACTTGVDYITVAGLAVNFAANETLKTVNVTVCADRLFEPNETVNLALSAPTGASLGTPAAAVLTINDTASQFRNTTSIDLTLGAAANPYPSSIVVTGGPIQIGTLRVTLYDLSHQLPDNIDVLLVGPTGRAYMLMGDSGGPTTINPTAPVTLSFVDSATQVLPDSAALTTGVFLPTTWEPNQSNFPAPAPVGPYNQPGSAVTGRTPTQTLIGNYGLTNANGTWNLFVRDDAGNFVAIVGSIAGGWGLEFLNSTAAGVSVSGRVTTADGAGIRNATVTVTGNSLTVPRVVSTGSFGYYNFDGLQAGETYVITVGSQRYTFQAPSRVISVVDNVGDADFTAQQ